MDEAPNPKPNKLFIPENSLQPLCISSLPQKLGEKFGRKQLPFFPWLKELEHLGPHQDHGTEMLRPDGDVVTIFGPSGHFSAAYIIRGKYF